MCKSEEAWRADRETLYLTLWSDSTSEYSLAIASRLVLIQKQSSRKSLYLEKDSGGWTPLLTKVKLKNRGWERLC